MASINASTSGAGGLISTADATGNLSLQSGGTTVVALTAAGAAVTGTGSVSGDLSFNSGYGSSAVAYGCRAWVNFNGTGTVAIRGSGNVTSITDSGIGQYVVNFTTSMPDGNYCVSTAVNQSSPSFPIAQAYIPILNTANVAINVAQPGTADYDASIINVAIFR